MTVSFAVAAPTKARAIELDGALDVILEVADTYLEDLVTGVEQGIYEAEDNEREIERVKKAIATLSGE